MKESRLPRYSANFGLLILVLFFLWPFYWMVSGSFKNSTVSIQIPPEWFPLHPTLDNYATLFAKHPINHWFYNSFFISIVSTCLVIVTSSLASYSLAKIRFRGSKALFALMVAAMAIPHSVLLIPLFNVMQQFHLVNTLWGVLLPVVGWPFGVFLLKQFIQTLPEELIDAAKIDGCSELMTFLKVILPLAKPGVAVLAIFTFVNSWNDYVWQLIMLNEKHMYTLPVGVKFAQKLQEFDNNMGMAMAGAVLATLPVLIVFLYFQKYFTEGLTLGAVKG